MKQTWTFEPERFTQVAHSHARAWDAKTL